MAALDFPGSPSNGDTFTSPNGGAVYTWDGTKWLTTSVASNTSSQNNVGRNLIHNPLFAVGQRGAGPFTTGGYTLDRWRLDVNLDAPTVTQSALTDTLRTQIGDETGGVCMMAATVGNAGAAAYTLMSQSTEDVRRLAGKTVTVSFWGWAASGTPKVGVGLRQFFGTGGSPSGAVDINATPVTLSTTATRYSVTVSLASIAGKTIGTNGDHYTRLAFFLSAGANTNTLAGGIGVQTGNFVFWGVQLEVSSAATTLEKPDPQQDLAKCQRFYCTGKTTMPGYSGAASVTVGFNQAFPVTMRAIPTITPTWTTQLNCTGTLAAVDQTYFEPYATAIAAGQVSAAATWTASADL